MEIATLSFLLLPDLFVGLCFRDRDFPLVSGPSLYNLRGKRLVALFKDDTGTIELVWFRGIRWIQNSIKQGVEYVVFGKPNIYKSRINIPHPDMDLVSDETRKSSTAMMFVVNMQIFFEEGC